MRMEEFLLRKAVWFAATRRLGACLQNGLSTSGRSFTNRNPHFPAGEWDSSCDDIIPRTSFSGASPARHRCKTTFNRQEFGVGFPAGLLERGRLHEAMTVVERMADGGVPITRQLLFTLLEECMKQRDLVAGRRLYALVVQRALDDDATLGKKFIRLFASEGCLPDAYRAFRKIAVLKATTWRAIISAFANQGQGEMVIRLYREMVQSGVQANDYIYVPVLQACASIRALREGKEIHSHIIDSGLESDLYVASTLIDMYAKCGSLRHARQVFDNLPQRSLVMWTAMIAGYARHGQGQEALELFGEMQLQGFQPNNVTFLCILQACASIAALDQGKQVHSQVAERGLQSDTAIGNALVDMYAKCGSLDDALLVFDEMQERDVISWTALLGGYAQKGQAEVALHLFKKMQQEGVKPSKVTLLTVLTACSHAGKLEEGSQVFESMSRDFEIAPEVQHYACMIDLLGRAGHLGAAEALINAMPVHPDVKIWTSMLSACQTYRNLELGNHCFNCIVQLEPECAAAYVLMSQIYAAAGRCDDAIDVRNMMKLAGVEKVPGRTWIEVDNSVVSFRAEDLNHSGRKQIFEMLKSFTNDLARRQSSSLERCPSPLGCIKSQIGTFEIGFVGTLCTGQ